MISLNDLYLDSCQWGQWDDHTEDCNTTVCGPQNYTRTRKIIQNNQPCEIEGKSENMEMFEECPLNECLGNLI